MTTVNRKAFTLIELIFVLVITGILAAVVLPRFVSVTTEAKKSKVLAFVGTLNSTVGATMYASTLGNTGNIGKVASATYCGVLSTLGNIYMEPISEVTVANDCTLTFTDVPVPTINTFFRWKCNTITNMDS